MVRTAPRSELELAGFGKRLDDQRLMIAPVELLYLMAEGIISVKKNETVLTAEEYFAFASDSDQELAEKDKVYTELRQAQLHPPDRLQVRPPLSGCTAGRTCTPISSCTR